MEVFPPSVKFCRRTNQPESSSACDQMQNRDAPRTLYLSGYGKESSQEDMLKIIQSGVNLQGGYYDIRHATGADDNPQHTILGDTSKCLPPNESKNRLLHIQIPEREQEDSLEKLYTPPTPPPTPKKYTRVNHAYDLPGSRYSDVSSMSLSPRNPQTISRRQTCNATYDVMSPKRLQFFQERSASDSKSQPLIRKQSSYDARPPFSAGIPVPIFDKIEERHPQDNKSDKEHYGNREIRPIALQDPPKSKQKKKTQLDTQTDISVDGNNSTVRPHIPLENIGVDTATERETNNCQGDFLATNDKTTGLTDRQSGMHSEITNNTRPHNITPVYPDRGGNDTPTEIQTCTDDPNSENVKEKNSRFDLNCEDRYKEYYDTASNLPSKIDASAMTRRTNLMVPRQSDSCLHTPSKRQVFVFPELVEDIVDSSESYGITSREDIRLKGISRRDIDDYEAHLERQHSGLLEVATELSEPRYSQGLDPRNRINSDRRDTRKCAQGFRSNNPFVSNNQCVCPGDRMEPDVVHRSPLVSQTDSYYLNSNQLSTETALSTGHLSPADGPYFGSQRKRALRCNSDIDHSPSKLGYWDFDTGRVFARSWSEPHPLSQSRGGVHHTAYWYDGSVLKEDDDRFVNEWRNVRRTMGNTTKSAQFHLAENFIASDEREQAKRKIFVPDNHYFPRGDINQQSDQEFTLSDRGNRYETERNTPFRPQDEQQYKQSVRKTRLEKLDFAENDLSNAAERRLAIKSEEYMRTMPTNRASRCRETFTPARSTCGCRHHADPDGDLDMCACMLRDPTRISKRGDIEVRLTCNDLTTNTTKLRSTLEQLEHKDKNCRCTKVEEEILHMAKDAFQKIRRKDDSLDAFRQFQKEVQETNKSIHQAMEILCSFKSLCKHGRTIDDIYSGSVVFTVNCPNRESLLDLWEEYRSGQLAMVMSESFVQKSLLDLIDAETISLNVFISEENFKLCRKEMEMEIEIKDVKSSSSYDVTNKCEERLTRPIPIASKSSPLNLIHLRSNSAPVFTTSHPAFSPSWLTRSPLSPFNRQRVLSFSSFGRSLPKKTIKETESKNVVMDDLTCDGIQMFSHKRKLSTDCNTNDHENVIPKRDPPRSPRKKADTGERFTFANV